MEVEETIVLYHLPVELLELIMIQIPIADPEIFDVPCLALLPDGRRFVTSSNDGTAYILEHGLGIPKKN